MSTDESNDPWSLALQLGRQLARWRDDAGMTQDDVARAAKRNGLEWTRTTVAAIEDGRRRLQLDEFFIVAGRIFDADLADWFEGRDEFTVVQLTERAAVVTSALRTALRGRPASEWRDDRVWYVPETDPKIGRMAELREEMAAGEAEIALARQLGITSSELVQRSFALWGRSLTEERDRRVEAEGRTDRSPRSVQARRGHVTRQLAAELVAEEDPQ